MKAWSYVHSKDFLKDYFQEGWRHIIRGVVVLYLSGVAYTTSSALSLLGIVKRARENCFARYQQMGTFTSPHHPTGLCLPS